MNRQPTAAVLIGIQGSGKSTFYHRFLSDMVHVNLDTLHTRRREKELIRDCLERGRSFAVDNTNPTRQDREKYITEAKAYGYRVIGYFLESKLQACIARNDLRTGEARLPAKAIAATSNRLELPCFDEGFDELWFVANDGEKMTISEWREEK